MEALVAVVADFFNGISSIINEFFKFLAGLFNFGGDADPTDPEDSSDVA